MKIELSILINENYLLTLSVILLSESYPTH
jgi:hypothetical protein